jgi:hypothetical protein
MTHLNEAQMVKYTTESTSNQSVEVNKVILNETKTTRRTLQSTIVKNHENPDAAIRITILNEKKGEKGFAIESPPDLRKLKMGECLSCELSSSDTLALYRELSRQYALVNAEGIGNGKNQYLVIKTSESTHLSEDDENGLTQLLESCRQSPGLAEKLAKLSPKLVENAHRYQLLEKKREGIERFKVMLNEECSELEWQKFFKEHSWILGGVHDIHYLSEIAEQPIFSGANVYGKGEKRGDFLACTGGSARFTGIVEIKRSSTNLLRGAYRQDVYCPSNELNGGLAQLRAYLRKWQIEGSRTHENQDLLERVGIYTIQPMGILIVGHLDEIKEDRKMREAFELFRQNQKDVHIITFDEVFGRAKQLLDYDAE